MRWLRLGSLAVLALCAVLPAGVPAAPLTTADPAAGLQALQDCLATTPATSPVHNPAPPDAKLSAASVTGDLIVRCPQIVPAIAGLGMGDQLGADWQHDLTRAELASLVRLTQRYRAGPRSAPPALAALPAVLRRLRAPSAPHSWWQDFKARLRKLLMQQGTVGSDWIARLLSLVPLGVQRALLFATTAAVVALAAWIILRELKIVGTLSTGREWRDSAAPALAPDGAAATRLPSLNDVEAAPLTERSVLLLRVLVQALRQAGKLAGDRALTSDLLT